MFCNSYIVLCDVLFVLYLFILYVLVLYFVYGKGDDDMIGECRRSGLFISHKRVDISAVVIILQVCRGAW